MAINVSAARRGWVYDKVNARLNIYVDGSEIAQLAIADHCKLNSVSDTKNVRINSRNYTQTSGSASGVQIKPNQNAATATISGLEVSPRFAAGIAGASLVAIKADPVLKAGAGDLSGGVAAVQANLDFGTSGTRTITGDVAAFETFLAVPNTYTYSALVTVMRVRDVNIKSWSAFLNLDSANTGCTQTSAAGSTGNMYLKVYVGSTLYTMAMLTA